MFLWRILSMLSKTEYYDLDVNAYYISNFERMGKGYE